MCCCVLVACCPSRHRWATIPLATLSCGSPHCVCVVFSLRGHGDLRRCAHSFVCRAWFRNRAARAGSRSLRFSNSGLFRCTAAFKCATPRREPHLHSAVVPARLCPNGPFPTPADRAPSLFPLALESQQLAALFLQSCVPKYMLNVLSRRVFLFPAFASTPPGGSSGLRSARCRWPRRSPRGP